MRGDWFKTTLVSLLGTMIMLLALPVIISATDSATIANHISFLERAGYTTWASAAGDTTFTGDLLPNLDNSYDLGSAAAGWKDGYFSGDLTAATGRTATYVVAASDAPAHVKAQADYVCDGTADDVEIQAAIAALPATGGTVQLMGGTYITVATVTVKTLVTLRGSGKDATIIKQADGNTNVNIISIAAAAYYPSVTDMTIDGNWSNNTAGDGIKLLGTAERPLLQNLLIYNCDGYLINIPNYVGGIAGLTVRDVYGWNFASYGVYAINLHSESLFEHCAMGNPVDTGAAYATDYAFYIESSKNTSMIDCQGFCAKGGLMFETCYEMSVIRFRGDLCTDYGLRLRNVNDSSFVSCIVSSVGQNGGAGQAVYLGSATVGQNQRNIFSGCQLTSGLGYKGAPFVDAAMQIGFQETGTADYNQYINNKITNALNTAVVLVGANNTVRSNGGWITENSGTAAILNTTTSIVVNHGLAATPTDVQISPAENPTNAVTYWWVDTLTATQFTIHVNADPGASNMDFRWRAVVGAGN